MRRQMFIVVALALGVTLGCASAAFGHSELEKADPKQGASVDSPPSAVTLTLSEDPAESSKVQVTDGCSSEVVTSTKVDGGQYIASIGDAQPGIWNVTYRMVSAEDGHETQGTYSFLVKGNADCSKSSGDTTQGAPAPDNGSGSSMPIVLIVVGVVVVVGIAAAVRVSSGK